MKKRLIKAVLDLIVADLLIILLLNISLCVAFDKSIREQDTLVYNQVLKAIAKPDADGVKYEAGLEEQMKINRLQFYVNGYKGSTILEPACYGLYDFKTGETICESNERIIQIISDKRNGEDDRYSYICVVLNEDEVNEFLAKHADDTVRVDSVSRKNLDCYITGMTATAAGSTQVSEEKFTFEVNDPEFEALTAQENLSLFTPISNSLEITSYPDFLRKYYESVDARNKARFDNIKKSGSSRESYTEDSVIKWFFFSPDDDSYINHTQKIIGPDGREYNYVSAFTFNIRQMYPLALLELFIVSLIIVAAVFFIREKIIRVKEKAKQETEDYRKNLMDTMAHDLKSPLTVISGYAETLKSNINEDKREYYSQAIMDSVDNMNKSIESILALSEIENAEKLPKNDDVSFEQIIKSAFASLEAVMEQKELSYSLEGDMKLTCNKELVERMVNNLVINAVTYATSGSVIEIKMSDKDCVISNHTDMDCDVDCSELVKPFVRGDKNRSGAKGNGLGLAIADSVAKYHNMKLAVKIEDNRFTVEISK